MPDSAPIPSVFTLRDYQQEAVDAIMANLNPDQPCASQSPTGSGKSLIAIEVAGNVLKKPRSTSVLFLAPRWDLCQQTLDKAPKLLPREIVNRCHRLGGNRKKIPLEEWDTEALDSIIFSTLHTAIKKLGRLETCPPSLAILDEYHYAQKSMYGRTVRKWCREHSVPVVGLTATPRAGNEYEVVYRIGINDLVRRGYLARPIPVRVQTHTRWSPEFGSSGLDFAGRSLCELASSDERNRLICGHYVDHAHDYGKAIIFACNRKHAAKLAEMLGARGIAAAAVFDGQSPSEEKTILSRFRSGEVQVIVNVMKLTHGFDVPDVKTVFLCRPTASDILFTQMVGRGSRIDEASGKREFYVVEFADDLDRFGDLLKTGSDFFGDIKAGGGGGDDGGRGRQRSRHGYDPDTIPRFAPQDRREGDPAAGLWFLPGQTFGIEIELTKSGFGHLPDEVLFEQVRGELLGAISERIGERYVGGGGGGYRTWDVIEDASAGWEIRSRILCGLEGMDELAVVCEAVSACAERLGLRMNHQCGFHLHLGWCPEGVSDLRRLANLVKLFEPALATLVSPSRVRQFAGGSYSSSEANRYCPPLARVLPGSELTRLRTHGQLIRYLRSDEELRYATVNLQNLNAPGAEGRTGTVEIRLHNGTLEAEKILPWFSLWQQILLVASEKSEMALPDPPPDRDTIDPSGDIVDLAQRYLPGANDALLKWLEKRRRTVMGYWLNDPSLKRQLEPAWIRWMTRGGIHRGKGYPEDLPDVHRDAYLWMLEISGQFQADVAEPILLTARRILRISLNDLRRSCGQAPFDNRRAGNLFGQVRRRRARVGAEKVEVPAGSLGEELRRLIARVTRSAVPELEAAPAIPEGSGSSGDPRVSASTLLSTVG